MAGFYSLLARTIATLPDASPQARRQVYERGRQTLQGYLQDYQPPLSAAEISEEQSSYEAAVAQIEVEFAVEAAFTNAPAEAPDSPLRAEQSEPKSAPPPRISEDPRAERSILATKHMGLRTHIRRNSIRSVFLVVGFPFVLPFVVFCGVFIPFSLLGSPQAFQAGQVAGMLVFFATLAITLVWLPIAYFINQWIIDRATGARLLTRSEYLKVWTLLDNLCTRCGMHMPVLRVIETSELNAYASGLTESSYSVTVTEGLMAALNDEELEGVLAHELTHILNRDVRLTVVAMILVGIVPIMETIFVRGFWYFVNGLAKIQQAIFTILPLPGAIILIRLSYGLCFLAGHCFAAVIGTISHVFSLVLNFSLSRRREFMADAGAIAITSNPEAMISALRKISGHSDIPTAYANVREMLFDNPRLSGIQGFFATHPTIQSRIDALVPYTRGTPGAQSGMEPEVAGGWGDKAGDLVGLAFLMCAIGTMSMVTLNASLNIFQGATVRSGSPIEARPNVLAIQSSPYQQQTLPDSSITQTNIFAYCRSVRDNEYQEGDLYYGHLGAQVSKVIPQTQFNPTIGWRCMDGALFVCELGASGRACTKKNPSKIPSVAITTFCRQRPNSNFAPMTVIGNSSSTWKCNGTIPIIDNTEPLDKRGYSIGSWTKVLP